MKIKELLGLNSYLWFGGSATHGSIESVKNFKLQRFFVDNFAVTQGTNILKTEPTWQGFKYDTYLQTLKTAGITTIWCLQGVFDWQQTNGGSTRKTVIPYPKDPNNPTTWADLALLCKQITQRYKTNGLVDYIEIINEPDFKWNIWRILTPEEYVVLFKECYTAIRQVSTTQKILMGGGISPSLDKINRFLNKLSQLYNGNPPKDFYLNFHWYTRSGSIDQGDGIGVTPEDANIFSLGQQLDNLCQTQGYLGWFCTESGWNTSPNTDATSMKSKAPTLQGFTLEEAQGILMIRMTLIWGACQYFKGVTFFHCRDQYDSEPFFYMGVNRKDWSPKPSNTICSNFISQYGEYEVGDYFKSTTDRHVATMDFNDNIISLGWSNRNNLSDLTPKPREINLNPQPTNPLVEINITGDLNKVNIQII